MFGKTKWTLSRLVAGLAVAAAIPLAAHRSGALEHQARDACTRELAVDERLAQHGGRVVEGDRLPRPADCLCGHDSERVVRDCPHGRRRPAGRDAHCRRPRRDRRGVQRVRHSLLLPVGRRAGIRSGETGADDRAAPAGEEIPPAQLGQRRLGAALLEESRFAASRTSSAPSSTRARAARKRCSGTRATDFTSCRSARARSPSS